MENQREIQLKAWCEAVTGYAQGPLQPVSGDASFRRYFRGSDGQRSVIAVDAPPPQERLDIFVAVAEAYRAEGVPVPEIIAEHRGKGFMLLSDLGSTLLLSKLQRDNARELYRQAIDLLPGIMTVVKTAEGPLPAYDEALLQRELALFKDWLLERHLGLELSPTEEQLWEDFCELMVNNAQEQPQVGVHRDYHSRNLMVLNDGSLAAIDFQDAVLGPVTYDLVSLLRDCYVAWPTELVQELAEYTRRLLQENNQLARTVSAEQWQRWFDLMGIQRHTKAAGIFARLCHRDGKDGYLNDVPRTLNYLVEVAAAYPELAQYHSWLNERVLPAWQQQSST